MIYQTIYQKLYTLLPNLDKIEQYAKLKTKGLMDLSVDVLRREEDKIIIALSHYYEQNGDLVPNPDITIAIYPEMKMAEALTYQDTYVYQQVYPKQGHVYPKLKQDLNRFLNNWLSTLLQGDYQIAPTPA